MIGWAEEGFPSSIDQDVPYEGEAPGEGFSLIIIIGLIFISLINTKALPIFLRDVIVPSFIESIPIIFDDLFLPLISELLLLVVPCFSMCFSGSFLQTVNSFWKIYPNDFRKSIAFFLSFLMLSLSLITSEQCQKRSSSNVIISLIANCIFPSICEEFVFRGWMTYFLEQNLSQFLSILLTSILFAICHPYSSLMSMFLIFLLSFGWSYANAQTNSLLVSICSHFFHNFSHSSLLQIFPNFCKISTEYSYVLWLLASLLLFFLFGLHHSETSDFSESEEEQTSFLEDTK